MPRSPSTERRDEERRKDERSRRDEKRRTEEREERAAFERYASDYNKKYGDKSRGWNAPTTEEEALVFQEWEDIILEEKRSNDELIENLNKLEFEETQTF